jgi:hypothetical protein
MLFGKVPNSNFRKLKINSHPAKKFLLKKENIATNFTKIAMDFWSHVTLVALFF